MMGSELFVSQRADRRSFSPKDTSAHSALDVSISRLGLLIVAFSLSLITVSLVKSNQDDPSLDIENDNVTQFLRENIETIRNGSFVYGSDSKYVAIQSSVIDTWLAALDSGMQRYNYGTSGNNFCWKREEIPKNETLHSLFRSSQLFIGVQVPIRASVLCSLLHRIFIITATLSLYTRGKWMWINSAVINESLHLVAVFTVFTLHVGQDHQYLQASRIALITALVTFIVKMFLLSTVKGPSVTTLCRLVFVIATILIGPSIVENWQQFFTYTTCDQMVLPTVAIYEWLFVVMTLASYLLDLIDGRSMNIVVDVFTEDSI